MTISPPDNLHLTCRCGAAQLHVTGQPLMQLYCHCDDCRAAHAAAYVAASIYPAAAVTPQGGPLTATVVRTTQRLHCAACGTYLFSDIPKLDMRSVNAFLLAPGQFQPQMHVQCQHAVLPVQDALPHYRDFPGSFGGTGALVGW